MSRRSSQKFGPMGKKRREYQEDLGMGLFGFSAPFFGLFAGDQAGREPKHLDPKTSRGMKLVGRLAMVGRVCGPVGCVAFLVLVLAEVAQRGFLRIKSSLGLVQEGVADAELRVPKGRVWWVPFLDSAGAWGPIMVVFTLACSSLLVVLLVFRFFGSLSWQRPWEERPLSFLDGYDVSFFKGFLPSRKRKDPAALRLPGEIPEPIPKRQAGKETGTGSLRRLAEVRETKLKAGRHGAEAWVLLLMEGVLVDVDTEPKLLTYVPEQRVITLEDPPSGAPPSATPGADEEKEPRSLQPTTVSSIPISRIRNLVPGKMSGLPRTAFLEILTEEQYDEEINDDGTAPPSTELLRLDFRDERSVLECLLAMKLVRNGEGLLEAAE